MNVLCSESYFMNRLIPARVTGFSASILIAGLLSLLPVAYRPLSAQQLVKGETYDIRLPAGYDSTAAYPLLIVLHGAYGNKEELQPYFIPDLYANRYVCLFAQSSEKSRGGYNWWNRIPDGRKVIRRAFEEICTAYPIDTGRVIIAGFSAGGTMAIDIALQDVLPVLGFIALCPGMPREFDSLLVDRMARRGTKGVILAGRGDYFRPYQLDMVDAFKSVGFEHQFTVIPNLGHEIPANFSNVLDAALQHVDRYLKLTQE